MSNFDLALSAVLGIGFAAATGFRVFLPLLVVSGAAYTGHLSLDDSFAWLGTPAAADARHGGAGRSRRLLHSGGRQPARHLGDPWRIRRGNGRFSGGPPPPAPPG